MKGLGSEIRIKRRENLSMLREREVFHCCKIDRRLVQQKDFVEFKVQKKVCFEVTSWGELKEKGVIRSCLFVNEETFNRQKTCLD